jgi:glycine dehydrogenase subunit 1
MYMASVGGSGLRDLARLNYDKSEYLKSSLKAAGFDIPFAGPHFNEFVVKYPAETYQRLREKKIIAGLPLEPYYPELPAHFLLCATETTRKEEIDNLVKELSS